MPTALRNRFLFSHLYLEQLCQDGEHQAEAADLIGDLQSWLPDWDDSSLSSLLSTQIEPTLVGLGFYYERSDVDRVLRLYADYGRETTLGLCYVANREDGEVDLDSTVKGRHYAAEIVHALKEEGLSWGLLTDGKRLRLYHADELAPYETFLEIDLERLLRGEGEPSDAALLFHLLFRQPAFELDENGECALDRHLQNSEETAEGIEEHLSDCIEEVLRDLCQGFVERDGKDTYTSDERDEVFRNATVLLYRVLFILYAEARDLLPLGDPAYDPHSLDALVEQAIDYAWGSGLPDPDGTELWQDLSDLCSWINSGDDERKIPAYNGDLFDDSDKLYIHDHTVADKYLAPALFSLGCLEDGAEAGYRRIDYRDLSVRHLGSIYEGLLEYKLFIAQEKRVRRSDGKGGYTFPRLSETRLKKGEEDDVIEVGEVYFAHSAGERKSMGAYYTPEYIVDYIVKQTVRRGLEERREALEEQLPGWLEDVEAAPPADRARLQRTVDQRLVDFVEQEVLTFRVCDPAMGSGHFLVNAAHTITNFIVETLSLTPWENADLDADPVTWRRRMAKHCLYGVDLNELAVELAKLSLWLTTVAREKPLSFLGHHLRHGNSLIGARLKDLDAVLGQEEADESPEGKLVEAVQLSMLEEFGLREQVKEAVDILTEISKQLAEEREDVADQAKYYDKVRDALAPYRQLGDLLTARHFEVEIDDGDLRRFAESTMGRSEPSRIKDSTILKAQSLGKERSFFHWELEFPDVFIDYKRANGKGDGGFDAVVGNPPYSSSLSSDDRHYFEIAFTETGYGYKNLALHFIEQSATISSRGFGLIVPKSITYSEGWRSSVELLWSSLTHAIDASEAWEDVLLEMVVLIADFCSKSAFYESGYFSNRQVTGNSPVEKVKWRQFSVLLTLASLKERKVAESVWIHSRPMGDIVSNYRGIGLQRFLEASGTIPVTRGKDIRRYESNTMCFLQAKTLEDKVDPKRYQPKRIVAQNVVAHITKPVNHIKIMATLSKDQSVPLDTVNNLVLESSKWKLEAILAILNSSLVSWYVYRFIYNCAVRTMHFDEAYTDKIPLPDIDFVTPFKQRESLLASQIGLVNCYIENNIYPLSSQRRTRVIGDLTNYEDVLHDLLAYLAEQMIELHKQRQELEQQVDLLRFVEHGLSFVRLDDAFVIDETRRVDDAMDLEAVHHDIDGLRLVPNEDGTWTLELQAKFRDPEQGWQEWIKGEDGYSIKRQWVPAYRLRMSEEKARFYRYALPRLQEFDNASSFPGGYTRSTLKKLHLTKVPILPDVDLRELARLDRELRETRRKIELTDDLIDQIVYKLYGLTEEEIAIVEGRA